MTGGGASRQTASVQGEEHRACQETCPPTHNPPAPREARAGVCSCQQMIAAGEQTVCLCVGVCG